MKYGIYFIIFCGTYICIYIYVYIYISTLCWRVEWYVACTNQISALGYRGISRVIVAFARALVDRSRDYSGYV